MFHLGGAGKHTEAVEMVIDCPACGQRGVAAGAWDEPATVRVFHIVPIWTEWQTFVACSACSAKMLSTIRVEQLLHRQPADMPAVLSLHDSFIRQALAWLAWICSVMPFFGVIMSVIAIIANRKSRRWPRAVSIASLLPAAICCFWMTPFEKLTDFLANP